MNKDQISEEELEIQRKRARLQEADYKSFYHTSIMGNTYI